MDKKEEDLKPQYDAQCAFAVSLGKEAKGQDKYNRVQDGKLYLFSNPVAKFLWKLIPNRKEQADLKWSKNES